LVAGSNGVETDGFLYIARDPCTNSEDTTAVPPVDPGLYRGGGGAGIRRNMDIGMRERTRLTKGNLRSTFIVEERRESATVQAHPERATIVAQACFCCVEQQGLRHRRYCPAATRLPNRPPRLSSPFPRSTSLPKSRKSVRPPAKIASSMRSTSTENRIR